MRIQIHNLGYLQGVLACFPAANLSMYLAIKGRVRVTVVVQSRPAPTCTQSCTGTWCTCSTGLPRPPTCPACSWTRPPSPSSALRHTPPGGEPTIPQSRYRSTSIAMKRDSATSFLTWDFFHGSVSPKPLSIPLSQVYRRCR
jgi:hypothetical protein